jgi:UDP-glucose 4-epimerase
MKCIVTGACGFVGINLVEKLLQDGDEVIGIDNFVVGTIDELNRTCKNFEKFKFYNFDFSKRYSDESIFEGVDTIYHLGGMSGIRPSLKNPDIWFNNNVVGTFNILEIARKYNIKNVVIASSSACLGDVDPPMNEDMVMRPISPYGASKGCKELYATAYYHSYGMNVSALRFSNVYGPHSTIKVSLVAKFIRKIIAGEELNIYGDGKQTRDFIYVKDLLSALQSAAKSIVGGEIFQISTGVETSVNEMTNRIIHGMLKQGFRQPEVNYTDPVPGDIMTNYADNTKARRMLWWEPQVSIEEGLEETINWFIGSLSNE